MMIHYLRLLLESKSGDCIQRIGLWKFKRSLVEGYKVGKDLVDWSQELGSRFMTFDYNS